jgi:ribosomal protein L11 methyltransferase
MLTLFPEGFEEIEHADGVELVAYTDPGGEERLWSAFGGVRGQDVEGGWEERWKKFHRPVRVGPLWIGPPWEQPPRDATSVVIDPGRAFGTGAHPTTQLCLELLLEREPSDLLDLGCGSGLLAIAAAKLGFDPVIALDSDAHAVAAACANAALNRVELDVRTADVLTGDLPGTSLAVANITRSTVEALAAKVSGPTYITSGYLEVEPAPIGRFRHVRRITREGWAADLHELA